MEIEKYNEQKGRIETWLAEIEDDSMAIAMLNQQIDMEPEDTDKARKKHMDGLKVLLQMSERTDLPSVTRSRGPHREAVYSRSEEIKAAAENLFEVAGEFMHKWDTKEEHSAWFIKNIAESHHRHQNSTEDDKNTKKGA